MVNYRGSTGYGQKLADAIFGDQNGSEARDVLAGWTRRWRATPGSTATAWASRAAATAASSPTGSSPRPTRFKAAVPLAGISNLVSFNYMAYYHDYLAVEFGAYPHEEGLMDKLWQRSPLRQVARVKTPVLFLHGENDNDVPIAEAEQFFIALKDVGVETVLVRYPREGHGLSETAPPGRRAGPLDRLVRAVVHAAPSRAPAARRALNRSVRTPRAGRRPAAPRRLSGAREFWGWLIESIWWLDFFG